MTPSLAFSVALLLAAAPGDEAVMVKPEPAALTVVPLEGGWTRWDGVGDPEWEVISRVTVLGGEVWVAGGGRLLYREGGDWKQIEARLPAVTGVARAADGRLWLSTADGFRVLKPVDGGWELTESRTYYEGHPAFVSGVYVPADGSTRAWGHVDGVFVPSGDESYAPFAISTEHGLFSSIHGSRGGQGWHHFLPHYWGANSPWLDLTELIPHRRPTCMAEDADGHLWVGTEWDGLVRFNAHARRYHERPPEDNEKDATEFATFGPKEVGTDFRRVTGLVPSPSGGVWAVLSSWGGGTSIARYRGGEWETWRVPERLGPARAVAEAGEGRIRVAGDRPLVEVDWRLKAVVGRTEEPGSVRDLVRLPDGTTFAASPWALYEKKVEAPAEGPVERPAGEPTP